MLLHNESTVNFEAVSCEHITWVDKRTDPRGRSRYISQAVTTDE